MFEKMKRLTATDFLKAGDVIGVSRKGLYEHYAVYLRKGRVIQKETTFLFNGSLNYYNGIYNQRIKRKTFSAKETVVRARSRVGETEYNLITNNCEHFAMWCKTGVSESSQVKNILNAAVAKS